MMPGERAAPPPLERGAPRPLWENHAIATADPVEPAFAEIRIYEQGLDWRDSRDRRHKLWRAVLLDAAAAGRRDHDVGGATGQMRQTTAVALEPPA